MKKTVAITLYFFIYVATFCQVGIGTTAPDPSAALDVSSNAKGLLIPQMTQVQRRAIDKPATGLLVLQTDSPAGFYYNAGTPTEPNWLNLSAYTLQQNINTNGKWISHSGKDSGLFVATQVAITHIIGHDVNNVWPLCFGCKRKNKVEKNSGKFFCSELVQ